MGGKGPTQVRKVNHFFFGDVVRKKSFNKEVITVSYPIINQQQFDQWKQIYQSIHNMNKDSLFVPQGYQYRKIQSTSLDCRQCCGAEFEAEITYEDFDFTLYAEIQNRIQRKKQYSQPELLFLLYRLLQGGKQFQKYSQKFGDIRTRNILVTRHGEIKMINLGSFPHQRTSMERVFQKLDTTTVFYFAPEEVQYIKKKGGGNLSYPNSKTEAWSIGLCVLESATLQSSQQLYEMPSRNIIDAKLTQRLKLVQRKFSLLFAFLRTILNKDPSQRMTSGQAWACMRPYGQKITEFEPFNRNQTAEQKQMRKFLQDAKK